MSLLNVDPNELFENHSIQEIEKHRIKIRHEIENKKEELRIMVGERYRDLIDAADSISNMTTLSQGVIADILDISKHCASIHELKISPSVQPPVTSLDTFVSQIKLLVDLNQLIWNHLDNHNVLYATILYQYAFYIKTNVNIEVPNANLLNTQWKSMQHFQKTIVSHCELLLEDQRPSLLLTTDCLLTLVLIENLSINELIDRYLRLRSQSLENCLIIKEEDSNVIKTNILSSYEIIINTIKCLFEIFNDKRATLVSHRKDVFCTDVLHLINLDSSSKRNSKYLPEIIQSYRINFLSFELVNNNLLGEKLLNWLSKTKENVKVGVENSLKFILSLKLTQDIDTCVNKELSEFPIILEQLGLPLTLNVWNEMYQVLIVNKAKHLISVKWSQCFDSVQAEILRALKSCNSDKNKESELDLRWYTWKESSNDLDIHEKKTNPDRSNSSVNASGLLLKCHGYTPRVISLCNSIQNKIVSLDKDLQSVDSLNKDSVLSKHQIECCKKSIVKLSEFVKDQIQNESITRSSCILLARFTSCLTQFCPALQQSLYKKHSQQYEDGFTSYDEYMKDTNNLDAEQNWNEIVALLLLCSHKSCDQYINLSKQHYFDMFSMLNENINISYILQTLSTWETIHIEEKTDSETVIQSKLQVPSQPTFVLQEALVNFTTQLTRISALNYLKRKLVDEILVFLLTKYNPIGESQTQNKQLVQKMHIQFIFDLKYVSNVLMNKTHSLFQVYNLKINEMENVIDVFELEVMKSYLTDNVTKCIERTQCLFGMKTSAHAHNVRSSSLNSCIVPLSRDIQWFPLIVLNKASKIVANPMLALPVNSNKKTTKSSSNVQTKPSSFFAVGDWFG